MNKSESYEEEEMKMNGKTKPLRNMLTETYVPKNLDSLTKIRMRLGDWVEGFEKENNMKQMKQSFGFTSKTCKTNLTTTEILKNLTSQSVW